MFILCYDIQLNKVDAVIEKLQINDIYDVFYESPLEITTDENGYGYIEKENELTTLKVTFDGEFEELKDFNNIISPIIGQKCTNIYEETQDYDDFSMPAIYIDTNWVLASPEDEIDCKNRINFVSQGAFGTGLHETTKDILRIILGKDFHNTRVLDIGTGSGILALATAIKGSKEVVAVDIRDVSYEVLYNASLNNLSNIKVVIGDILSAETNVDGKFNWIYINIGGEETSLFIDYIKKHLDKNGFLLISGLVEWSFEKIKTMVESHGFKMIEKHQSNEWCTAIFNIK